MTKSLSYRNKFIDLLCKSMDWFLYDRDLRHERVKYLNDAMRCLVVLKQLRNLHKGFQASLSRKKFESLVTQIYHSNFP